MVERSGAAVEERLDSLFHALASAPRRDLLRRLSEGERTISELVEPSDLSFSNISKHIQVLEGAGLIHRRKVGRTYIVGLRGDALAKAAAWLNTYEEFWTTQFDSLELSFIAEREQQAIDATGAASPRNNGRKAGTKAPRPAAKQPARSKNVPPTG